MPVGDTSLPQTIYSIQGVKLGITKASVRYKNRRDLLVIELPQDVQTAVVTTQNAFAAAPVQIVREHIQSDDPIRYLVVNTGNANAATGDDGYQRATNVCKALAEKTKTNISQILPYSTGVIGETLNSDAIVSGLDDCLENLQADNWQEAAHAICTTDTIPKVASTQIEIDGETYTITGIAKGAGMIRPNMATMLGFVATDANIAPELLQSMLKDLVNLSFNRITVEGDTSTNDCCTLMATGQTLNKPLINSTQHPHYHALFDALEKIFVRLATLIVRDGEGATKFITVAVTGGKDTQECCDVAYAIAHSPLVKTAFFASDPNWGRIVAAVGYAGVPDLDANKVSVKLDNVAICTRGQLDADYTEAKGQAVMTRPEITIHIDLGRGKASDTVYTCDLSHDYVTINADYRS